MTKSITLKGMLLLSLSFNVLLILIRVCCTQKVTYVFLGWNLLLAAVPWICSNWLCKQQGLGIKTVIVAGVWLLFLPNAPYIVTDIFHFTQRGRVPLWYDLLLLTSSAMNGLLLAITSWLQVEMLAQKCLPKRWLLPAHIGMAVLCGYGVYIGRFIRWNSWDIITAPHKIVYTTLHYFLKPWHHVYAWGFIGLFACMLLLLLYTIKSLGNFQKQTNFS